MTSKNTTKPTTPVDGDAQEQDPALKIVPGQVIREEQGDDINGDMTAGEGEPETDKKTFSDRLTSMTEMLKRKKVPVLALGAAIGIAAGVLLKNRLGVEPETEMDTTVTEDEKKAVLDEMAAGDIGG